MNALVAPMTPPSMPHSLLRLVRFDLQRCRWLALLVVAIEIVRAAFVEWAAHVVPPVIGERFGGTFGTQEVALLDAVVWLATLLGTAAIVQADLPSDDRAFWRTRPIAPAGVALAKLAILALLFVAMPAAINAGRLVAYGAPLPALGAATLQLAVGAGYVVVPAWGLALITRTLPRFCGAAVASVIGGLMILSAALYWAELWSGRGGQAIAFTARSFVGDWQRLDVHGWWFAAGITAVAAGILCAHYAHRRAGRSAAAVATVLVVSWLLPAQALPSAPPGLTGFWSAVAIERIEVPTESRGEPRPRTPYPVSLRLTLGAPALPRDVSAAVFLERPRVGGAGDIEAGGGSFCCFGAGAVGVLLPPLPPPSSRQQGTVGLPVGVNELPLLRQPSLSIDADAEVRFLAHRWIGTLPIRPGTAFQAGGRTIEILAVQPDRSTILVRYTRFPSLDESAGDWTLYGGPPTRVPLTATTAGWGSRTPLQSLTGQPRDRGTGRHWVGRFHVLVQRRDALAGDSQLYVVESVSLGTARHRLARTGVLTGADHAPAR